MSYDLYFCRDRETRFGFGDLEAWTKETKHFKKEHPTQLFYENEDTGVYFVLEENSPEDEEEGESLFPEGYYNAGFSFSLNLVRPTFFAMEAMPLIEQIESDLGVLLVNPQVDDETPRRFSAVELISSWSKSNEWATGAVESASEKPKITQEKASQAWSYNFARPRLEALAEDAVAFVPHIMFVRPNASTSVETLASWTPGIPTVLPFTDWIALFQKRKFLSTKEEVVYVSAKTALDKTRLLLEPFGDTAGMELFLLPEHNVSAANRILAGLTPELVKGQLTRVAADDIRDV